MIGIRIIRLNLRFLIHSKVINFDIRIIYLIDLFLLIFFVQGVFEDFLLIRFHYFCLNTGDDFCMKLT